MTPDDAEFWEGPGKIVGTIKMVAAAATNSRPDYGDEPQGRDVSEGGQRPLGPRTRIRASKPAGTSVPAPIAAQLTGCGSSSTLRTASASVRVR